jgi:hypothetical protein
MRVLLVIAVSAIAVVAMLVWPRGEAEHGCRAPASGMHVARRVDHAAMDGEAIAVGLGGPTHGVESGECALRLRMLDESTGKPFAGNVELWRLDLPEDESWTAGDQLQAAEQVGPDGRTFTDLPAGCYRITAHGQSYLTEDDPPAFFVRGAVTDVALPVRAPRSHRVFLRVFNEAGRESRTGELRRHGATSYGCGPAEPGWARPRRPKAASASRNRALGVGGRTRGSGDGHGDAPWTEAGFDLERFREDSRAQRRTTKLSMVVPGHSTVLMAVSGRLTGDCTYVAVAVSMEELKRLVFLPDGRRAADAGALFEARSRAVVESPLSPDAWRSLPVKVRVALSGYEMLTFEYRVDRPPLPQGMRRNIHG